MVWIETCDMKRMVVFDQKLNFNYLLSSTCQGELGLEIICSLARV